MSRKWKCPYTFPARSRKAMVDYICDRQPYSDRYQTYPFEWNIKANHVDWERPKGEHKLNPRLDDKWRDYVQDNSWVEEAAFEDARRYLSDGEYTTYPGADQGDWEFEFAGRQGGHLVLTKWLTVNVTKWCMEDMREELMTPENDHGWDFRSVRKFYRAMVTMDNDFTPEKASQEVEYQLNWLRGQWEEEQDEELTAEARAIETTRPDLYQGIAA